MFDPQVQLHYEHDGLPYRGDFVGREALAGIVRDILSDWAFLEVTPFAFAVHNGLIAVLGRYEGEGKVTHFPFVDRFVHLWEVPGERAVRFATYRSAAQAMRDLDRSPWTPPA